MVASRWLLFALGSIWVVSVVSGCHVDGCCYFLVAFGWLPVLPIGIWMVAVNFWYHLVVGWVILGSIWIVVVRSW